MAPKRSKKEINNLILGLDKYDEHVVSLDTERKHFVSKVFNVYLTKEKQVSLIDDLERTCYSRAKTEDIKRAFSDFNTDTIDINIARTIVEAEKHIREYTKDEGFFSAIANVLLPED